jgi:hypothetical protein
LCNNIVAFVEFIFAFIGEEEEEVRAFIPSAKMIVSMNFNVSFSSFHFMQNWIKQIENECVYWFG